jgi:hypothetical protein
MTAQVMALIMALAGAGQTPLNQAGGKVVIWKKETLAGLPALQIVADLAAIASTCCISATRSTRQTRCC